MKFRNHQPSSAAERRATHAYRVRAYHTHEVRSYNEPERLVRIRCTRENCKRP